MITYVNEPNTEKQSKLGIKSRNNALKQFSNDSNQQTPNSNAYTP